MDNSSNSPWFVVSVSKHNRGAEATFDGRLFFFRRDFFDLAAFVTMATAVGVFALGVGVFFLLRWRDFLGVVSSVAIFLHHAGDFNDRTNRGLRHCGAGGVPIPEE